MLQPGICPGFLYFYTVASIRHAMPLIQSSLRYRTNIFRPNQTNWMKSGFTSMPAVSRSGSSTKILFVFDPRAVTRVPS